MPSAGVLSENTGIWLVMQTPVVAPQPVHVASEVQAVLAFEHADAHVLHTDKQRG